MESGALRTEGAVFPEEGSRHLSGSLRRCVELHPRFAKGCASNAESFLKIPPNESPRWLPAGSPLASRWLPAGFPPVSAAASPRGLGRGPWAASFSFCFDFFSQEISSPGPCPAILLSNKSHSLPSLTSLLVQVSTVVGDCTHFFIMKIFKNTGGFRAI